jgi:hypothetical protein
VKNKTDRLTALQTVLKGLLVPHMEARPYISTSATLKTPLYIGFAHLSLLQIQAFFPTIHKSCQIDFKDENQENRPVLTRLHLFDISSYKSRERYGKSFTPA